jgi:hypothetical protein
VSLIPDVTSRRKSMRTAGRTLAFFSFVAVAAPAYAQMDPPQPGPEHKILSMDAGTWDASLELKPPGMPAMNSKGVEENVVGCGGLCLVTSFKSEMGPGAMFEGHGLTAYDATTKKYVGSWTDSMSSGIATSEGTYDEAAKTMTSSMEAKDPSGNVAKSRAVSQYLDADHKVMTMYTTGPDGKEIESMKISYTRRK